MRCLPDLCLFRSVPVALVFFIPCAASSSCPEFLPLPVLAVLALPSLCALGNAFPAFKCQPKHHSLREPIPDHLTFRHLSYSTPHSHLSESCHSSHSTSCLFSRISFTTAILHLLMSLLHSYLYFLIRLCESRKHTCLCSPLCPPCLVQGQLIVDSVYICGIDRLWDIWLGKCVDFHCYSPVIDLTQFDSSIFWFGSTLHCLPLPIVSSLLILSSSKVFFLKDCTHSFMRHISVTHSDQHHI